MSDLEKMKTSASEETEDGMLIIFPDENEEEETYETSSDKKYEDNDESFSLSFGKVNAARKEEEFSFLPFLNIPEVIDEEEDDDADEGEGFSLSFGKVSAAKKERDYVYMPFLNVDETAVEEEESEPEDDREDEEDDSGIDIVGGDELFDLTPLKTRDTSAKSSSSKRDFDKASKSSAKRQQPPAKKGKGGNAAQKKKQPQRPAVPQKPNKVQQILAQMDPDIIASVSSDPRQMMMLEETIRSELIKQAAHNAVARELGADILDVPEIPKKRTNQRPPQQGKQKNPGNQGKRPPSNSLNFSRQEMPRKKNNPISIVDTSSISEFGAEVHQPQVQVPPAVIQQSQNISNVVQPSVAQIPSTPQTTPIIQQPLIVTPSVQSSPIQSTPVQPASTPSSANQSSASRKNYTPTSPAAIRAAMKSGAISFDKAPSSQNNESSDSSASSNSSAQSAQTRRRMEIQKQLSEKRSGCVIGAIALLMIVFIGIIALISGGDIVTQCNYNEKYAEASQLVQSKKYTEAIDVLQEIKDYSQTAALLNECYYALGKEAEAEGEYEKAISYYNNCIEYDSALRSKIDLMTVQADEYRNTAEDTNDIDAYLSAYSMYSSILSDLSENPEIENSGEVNELRNKTDSTRFAYAKLLYGEENYSDAKVHFENLMNESYAEADKWFYNSCYNIGKSYFENGNYLSAYDELSRFRNEQHGIADSDYSKATAYYALASFYRITDMSVETTDSMQGLFDLLENSYEEEHEDSLKKELEEAMSVHSFDKVKLIGSWNNDNENYLVFDGDGLSIYIANEAAGGLSEIYSDEVKFEDGSLSAMIDGKEYVIMQNIEFQSTYQMAPHILKFVNPYDGQTYTMYRFR